MSTALRSTEETGCGFMLCNSYNIKICFYRWRRFSRFICLYLSVSRAVITIMRNFRGSREGDGNRQCGEDNQETGEDRTERYKHEKETQKIWVAENRQNMQKMKRKNSQVEHKILQVGKRFSW